ncbi:hypothetical protein E4N80_11020 [Treponema denticola]|uniref:hypothetical protein n=1 Tax=Treponema denticola TaxID=158 RepID=UPI0020A41B1D|nr:hypothetical protein [Treponema denticola]UTD05971.1 hypothetical protein E4N80_11020 [Treponema denticola]
MFLLKLMESGREHLIGAFDSEANIKAFLEKIPGFEVYSDDEYGVLGKLHVAALGGLVEIAYGKKKFPLSRFSFVDDEAEAIAIEVEAFDDGKANTVEGCTLVDAYLIGNNELKTYIEKRERNFLRVKAVLEKKGFSVFREYHGSEDGEAVTYRDANGQYRFLMHMDPGFVDDLPEDDAELELYISKNENI